MRFSLDFSDSDCPLFVGSLLNVHGMLVGLPLSVRCILVFGTFVLMFVGLGSCWIAFWMLVVAVVEVRWTFVGFAIFVRSSFSLDFVGYSLAFRCIVFYCRISICLPMDFLYGSAGFFIFVGCSLGSRYMFNGCPLYNSPGFCFSLHACWILVGFPLYFVGPLSSARCSLHFYWLVAFVLHF